MENNKTIERVAEIYNSTLAELDTALIGQKNVKKVVAAAILCDTNSKILLTGNTGMGKTTLSNFLASSFDKERINVTSDMIPSDIQEQLKRNQNMEFLQIEEFNRGSGKVTSSLIELFAEKQMSICGTQYTFNDFYVFATQNSADIAGIFNVPQAVYDRFDINVYFESLEDYEKRELLFGRFVSNKKSNLSKDDIAFTKRAVNTFKTDEKDENIMMQIFDLIDSMTFNEKKLFAGSNIRAHKFALKLAKLMALSSGRNYLLPADIADFIKYLYMHRIDQNIATIGTDDLVNKFQDTEKNILTRIKRR